MLATGLCALILAQVNPVDKPLAALGTPPSSEIVNIRLGDGEVVAGKLDVPKGSDPVKTLVLFVHGTGPATYLNRRKIGSTEFNYFDLFSKEFTQRRIAFFVCNKRGVSLSDAAPTYETVDPVKFRKVVPSVEVKDIRATVAHLRKQRRFQKAKVVLFGWSEGSVLAAMAADDPKSGVDALFLAGYCNENMYDIIKWQFSGESSITNIGKYFDTDKDRRISKPEFESTDATVTAVRTAAFKEAKFEQLDLSKDGFISAEDFRLISENRYKAVLQATERGDDDWIWKNYFHVTAGWLREHFALEPNKSRLIRLNLPIHIFHGAEDANCPVDGVLDIQRRFETLGKKNLTCHVFEGLDHNLNYMDFILKKQISPGISKIFEVAESLAK